MVGMEDIIGGDPNAQGMPQEIPQGQPSSTQVLFGDSLNPQVAIADNKQEEDFLRKVRSNDRTLEENSKLIMAFQSINEALQSMSPTDAIMDLLPSELDDQLIDLIRRA